MRKLHTRKGGFTLIELMIVVAIIGILAAIAIPNFLMFQLRSKTGEAKTNLAGIRTAQEGYFAEFGTYVPAPAALPAGAPGSSKRPWPAPGAAAGFDTIGWGPEGQVFFQYTLLTNAAPPAVSTMWSAGALGDLDATGAATSSSFGYVHPLPGGVAGLAVLACPNTGVYNPTTAANDLLNTVGPCNATSGQSVF
jgi:type IV pilus assembly protein PilA